MTNTTTHEVMLGGTWYPCGAPRELRSGGAVPGARGSKIPGRVTVNLTGDAGIRALAAGHVSEADVGNGGPSLDYPLGFVTAFASSRNVRARHD